ncbi:Uma2 family endonuclease [Thiofilum flexile]|uniref:Uma2 family endonuclease n=1 Tax=Thiofilum flexile TaxID=125627 RepID=UPI0003770A21|nr:Uma2 family endonuclease [Thiofilum flexile]
MQQVSKLEYLTFEEYLAGEPVSDVRYEYIAGQVYAMAGGSELHNTVAATFHGMIENALPDHCRSWQSDMKVVGKTQGEHFAYYPDIMASCEVNKGDNPYIRDNPCLIIEVLSPSTQRIDLKEKFDGYTQITSLLEYVVVSQDTPYLRIFRRRTHWQAESFYADDTFTLESIGLTAMVKQIYRRVKKEVGLIN